MNHITVAPRNLISAAEEGTNGVEEFADRCVHFLSLQRVDFFFFSAVIIFYVDAVITNLRIKIDGLGPAQ